MIRGGVAEGDTRFRARRRASGAVLVAALLTGACDAAPPAPPPPLEPEAFDPFPDLDHRLVNGIAFSPAGDEMFFTLFAREVTGSPSAPEVGLFRSRFSEGTWSEPEPLAINQEFDSYEPTLTADGLTMVFNSSRPYDDGQVPEVNDLWMTTREEGGEWAAPRRLDELTTFEFEESYSAFSPEQTLVFLANRPTETDSVQFDLHEARLVDGRFEPARVHPVSTARWGEGDPWISPDGDVLVFTRWDDRVGWLETVDLYISYRTGEGWSDPVPLADLNTDGADYSPGGSPDGRWFYYRADSRFMRVELEAVVQRYRPS